MHPCLPCHPQTSLKKKEAELELVAPYSRSYGRTMVKSVLESESEGLSLVRVGGLLALHTAMLAGVGQLWPGWRLLVGD